MLLAILMSIRECQILQFLFALMKATKRAAIFVLRRLAATLGPFGAIGSGGARWTAAVWHGKASC